MPPFPTVCYQWLNESLTDRSAENLVRPVRILGSRFEVAIDALFEGVEVTGEDFFLGLFDPTLC